MQSNRSRLRVGYEPIGARPTNFEWGLDIVYMGFDIDFVPIVDYEPSGRAANNQWTGEIRVQWANAGSLVSANLLGDRD